MNPLKQLTYALREKRTTYVKIPLAKLITTRVGTDPYNQQIPLVHRAGKNLISRYRNKLRTRGLHNVRTKHSHA
jgi:hypothetical protein